MQKAALALSVHAPFSSVVNCQNNREARYLNFKVFRTKILHAFDIII